VEQVEWIRVQAHAGNVRVTIHAHEEMVEEGIRLDEVLEALTDAEILEDYPEHRRGPCCLALGHTREGRPLHVVCATERPVLVIITLYEPTPPKWVTPRQRRGHGSHEV
jgi:Domain of unknown function (DUF4258)